MIPALPRLLCSVTVMLTAKMGFTCQHLQKQWLTKGGVVSGENNAASLSGIARQQGSSVLALNTNHNKTCLIRPAQAPATCQYTTAYTVRAEQNHFHRFDFTGNGESEGQFRYGNYNSEVDY